jgi:hypothetical protein
VLHYDGKAVVYYESQMRRALSILLMVFFGLGPLATALPGGEDPRLPACCRRHGAHHCSLSMAMAGMGKSDGKPGVQAPATCPYFPGYTAAATTTAMALAAQPMSLPALLAQPHTPVAARAAAVSSQIRTRAGRGPPASSLA